MITGKLSNQGAADTVELLDGIGATLMRRVSVAEAVYSDMRFSPDGGRLVLAADSGGSTILDVRGRDALLARVAGPYRYVDFTDCGDMVFCDLHRVFVCDGKSHELLRSWDLLTPGTMCIYSIQAYGGSLYILGRYVITPVDQVVMCVCE